jgi:hypothetical protein
LSQKPKKAFLIAPYFVPRRRVGALRPFKFSIHLNKFGWQPHILSIKSDNDELTDTERELLQHVSVFELKPPFDKTVNPKGKNGGTSTATKKSIPSSISDKISSFIDRNFPIDTWLPLFWLNYNTIKKQVESVNPDILFSTGDPWSAHWLGYKLSKRYDIPWVADFRDPWTLTNINLKQRSGFSALLDKKWEAKILNQASWVTFTSEATLRLYEKAYPIIEKNSTAIYNSFDKALYETEITTDFSSHFNEEDLNLVFWGAFRRLSPISSILKVLKDAQNIDPDRVNKIKIHSFGKLSKDAKNEISSSNLASNFITHNPVPPEYASSVLNAADVLLVSTNPERKDIIPAKLWDYLPAKPPVLSIAPNPEIKEILLKTGRGVQFTVESEIKEASQILLESVEAKQRNQKLPFVVTSDASLVDKFDAEHTAKELTAIFEQLIS